MQLPEPGVVIRAGRNKIGRVCTECAVPYPALVAGERSLERERLGLVLGQGCRIAYFPNLGRVVGAAGGELLDIGREQDTGDVLLVGAELGDGNEASAVKLGVERPDEDVAL